MKKSNNVVVKETNLAKVKKSLFMVEKISLTPVKKALMTFEEFKANEIEIEKLYQNFPDNEAGFESYVQNAYTILFEKKPTFEDPENTYGIYKTTGGHSLGVMGKDFTPMQPIEFYNKIIETVGEVEKLDTKYKFDLNTLEFREYKGGSKIEFSISLEPLTFVNAKKLEDVTNIKLTFSTSFDGTKSNIISLYTERLVCLNGMVALNLEGYCKGRNTLNGKAKVLTFTEQLALIVTSGEKWREKMIELDKVKITKKQIEAFKLQMFGYNRQTLNAEKDPKTKEIKANVAKHKFLDVVEECLDIEFKRTGITAFGLLQGITYYTNHEASRDEKISKDEYIRFFQGAKTNDKAQELIYAMAN